MPSLNDVLTSQVQLYSDPNVGPQASPYAIAPPSNGYITPLTAQEQPLFNAWVQQNNIPYDPSATADYDMPGFWKGLQTGDPAAIQSLNANDGVMHFNDKWKTPYHQSFSNESKYAQPNAPHWNSQDQLVDSAGRIVYDERAQNK